MPDALPRSTYVELVRAALAEDVSTGDITTGAIVPPWAVAHGEFLAKSPCVLAGLDVVREVFSQAAPSIVTAFERRDGEACQPGDRIGLVDGPAAALLIAERTALNFLQYLSGIATLARAYVDAAEGRVTILDTRKTTPGFRALAKYAARCGGVTNHRAGLYDGVLIKDNHIRLAGTIARAVALVRATGTTRPIEVEAQSLDQVREALAADTDIIMLDNLDNAAMAEAIAEIAGRAKVEISGGMTIARVRAVATLGADFVSVGAITHSAPAADISLELEVRA